jgi:transposase
MEGGVAFFQANQFLWKENQRLREELRIVRGQLQQREDSSRRVAELGRRCERLEKRNLRLEKRVAELTQKLLARPKPPAAPPGIAIKPNTRSAARKTPGRKAGHAAALRPGPANIDVHRQLPLPVDPGGKISCLHCNTQLSQVRHHRRIIEDFIPAKVITTCYHTASGYCPSCRKVIETRADEQPPAADLPHAQLGLNALSTAAMMRVCYRLPLRQITQLFADLPGLKISPGGISKQLIRLSQWLEGQYHRLKLLLRAAGVVYADETSWRNDGKNAQLWTLTNDRHTLYHVDDSRSGRVIAELLGEAFGADGKSTLVSDFYGVYDQFDCPQQKCLAHLLRELKETIARRAELADHAFFKRCKRLVRDMLALKTKRDQFAPEVYQRRVQLLEKRLKQLGKTLWHDADADRLAARLRKHDGKLTTFLHKPEVEGTNNHAERALRPAVVLRKITGGNRSEKAAKAWAILASVMRTAQQQGRDVLETIQTLLKAGWAGKNIALLTDVLTPVETNTS